MNRSMLARIVDAFFRRWYLYLIPLVLMVAVGLLSAGQESEYSSDGTVFVDRGSFITNRTGIGDEGTGSYLTPAEFTSQELNGLLLTDAFMESVLEDAGIELDADPSYRAAQITAASRSIISFATSENLLQIRVTTGDPGASEALARSTINQLIDFKIELDTADSTTAGSFFSELADAYQEEVNQAQAALDSYLQAISARTIDQLTPAQQTELDRLSAAATLAEQRHDAALDDLEASRLATLQAETDVRQSLSVVDPPQATTEPNSGLTGQLMTIVLFTVVGILLAAIGPAAAAMLNRTVLLPDELADVTDGGVLVVVPTATKRQRRLTRLPDQDDRTKESHHARSSVRPANSAPDGAGVASVADPNSRTGSSDPSEDSEVGVAFDTPRSARA